MQIHEKIRMMREINQWTQEELAEKLNISPSGYAKIERGENSINIERLEQIANVFNIDVWELMKPTEKYCIFQITHKDNQTISENSDSNEQFTIYSSSFDDTLEIEKLKLTIKHQQELLTIKDQEINRLERFFSLIQGL